MPKQKKSIKDKKVLFKENKTTIKKRKQQRRVSKVKQSINPKRLLFYAVILLLLGTVIYLGIRIFTKPTKIEQTEQEMVMGLEDIPTYPESTFLYINNQENDVVKDMLANGKSAYTIPNKDTFEDVKIYYANELTSKGWDLVLDVDISSEDKKYGQYWVNEEKGLRIYSKYKDIWYEYITITQAQNGLSDRVSTEIEIDMLLAGSDHQDLLPDYPWQIKIPKDYLIRYELSEFEELRAVNFQRISTGLNITIYPIGYWGAKALDYQLNDYVELLSTGSEKWSVINTYVTSFRNNSSLSGTISSGSSQKDILILKNDKNAVTYILSADDKSDPLYEYIVENIKYLGEES